MRTPVNRPESLPKTDPEPLIPKYGGYRKLKSYRMAQLVSGVAVLSRHGRFDAPGRRDLGEVTLNLFLALRQTLLCFLYRFKEKR